MSEKWAEECGDLDKEREIKGEIRSQQRILKNKCCLLRGGGQLNRGSEQEIEYMAESQISHT